MEESKSNILNYLEQLAKMDFHPKQKAWYERQLSDARLIQMSPMSELLNDKELCEMLRAVKLRKNECYRNSVLVVEYLNNHGKKAKYVEGQTCVCGIPIDHAWIQVGEKYFDPTLELLLENEVEKDEYVALGSWEINEVWRVLVKTGVYGEIYKEKYIESLTKKK